MKFSVIIPLYNKALYVGKAVQSVLLQTYADYELVIVDDGSTDQSAELASKAIEGHDNCRMIRQENEGVSMARNNGVAISHGDYLCFLDADDWWNPCFLEEMAGLIAEFPDAGIYGTSYIIVSETKHKTRVSPIGVENGFEKGYINYCQVYEKTLAMPLFTSAVCIPHPVFDELQGFPKGISMGEDFLLWIHIALKYKVVFLNKPLAYYNQDVDLTNRAVGRLHEPKEHMLWNLADLEPLEETNGDYKRLVDALRVEGLMEYYISKEYHQDAQEMLSKVDWSKRPQGNRREYQLPLVWLRLKYKALKLGSKLKNSFQ